MKALLISFLLFLIGYFGFLNGVQGFYTYITSPIQFGLYNSAKNIKESIKFYSTIGTIYKDYENAQQEILTLNSKISDLTQYKEENDFLKKQLATDLGTSVSADLLMANILGNSSDLSGSTVFLDKGEKHGVKVGDSVILEKYLVGEIIETKSYRSKLRLVTSPDFVVTVYNANTEGLAKGRYGTSVIIEKILQSEELHVGDTVITSGRDGKFQPGLIIGKVASIESSPSDPLKSAVLSLDYDLSALKKVFIMKEN